MLVGDDHILVKIESSEKEKELIEKKEEKKQRII